MLAELNNEHLQNVNLELKKKKYASNPFEDEMSIETKDVKNIKDAFTPNIWFCDGKDNDGNGKIDDLIGWDMGGYGGICVDMGAYSVIWGGYMDISSYIVTTLERNASLGKNR